MADIVEQDTIHSEDTVNIVEFIRDGMPNGDACLQEGLHYNRRLFDGWMKQPSACCAAASVAGAFNALACLQRTNEGALTHLDILLIYESIFIDLISKHKNAYERMLGASIDSFLITLGDELLKVGREIGGKKGANASTVSVIRIIKRISQERYMLRPKASIPAEEGTQIQILMLCVAHLINDILFTLTFFIISFFNSYHSGEQQDVEPGLIPIMPSESISRDAVECFIELLESEGFAFQPNLPEGRNNINQIIYYII